MMCRHSGESRNPEYYQYHMGSECLIKSGMRRELWTLKYVREPEEILITAVAHLHRDPEHYRDRIILNIIT
jgi:hypothetical protein